MAGEAEEVPEDLTVRGSIKAAMTQLAEERDPPEPVAPPENETPEAKEARERDEQGRFVKGEKNVSRETLTLPEKKGKTEALVTSAGVLESKPPNSWSAEAKAKFATLDPVVQKEVLRREAESHKAITSQDEERTFGKQVREAVSPYMNIINAEGTDPVTAVKSLLNMAYIMRMGTPDQKLRLLYDTARLYNVPLQAQQVAALSDPRLESLQQRLDRIEQAKQAESVQRQQQEDSSLRSEIEAFAAADGHEHFEVLKPYMAAFFQSGTAKTLQEAYDQALWANPDIRSTLLAQEEAKRLSPPKPSKVDAARRASVSVTGAPGPANGLNGAADPNRSLRDELRANIRAATGRV